MDNNQQMNNNCGSNCGHHHHGRGYHIAMLMMMVFIIILLIMVLCGVYNKREMMSGYGMMKGYAKQEMREMREDMMYLKEEIEELKGSKKQAPASK